MSHPSEMHATYVRAYELPRAARARALVRSLLARERLRYLVVERDGERKILATFASEEAHKEFLAWLTQGHFTTLEHGLELGRRLAREDNGIGPANAGEARTP